MEEQTEARSRVFASSLDGVVRLFTFLVDVSLHYYIKFLEWAEPPYTSWTWRTEEQWKNHIFSVCSAQGEYLGGRWNLRRLPYLTEYPDMGGAWLILYCNDQNEAVPVDNDKYEYWSDRELHLAVEEYVKKAPVPTEEEDAA